MIEETKPQGYPLRLLRFLAAKWRRVWDSNPRAQRANGFQDRLVMTTSITLRRLSFAKDSVIWREFRERTMKFLRFEKCRKPL